EQCFFMISRACSSFILAASVGASMVINNVSNGVINLSVSPTPTVAPVIGDFVVMANVNGVENIVSPLTITGAANNPAVTLNFAQTQPTSVGQTVIYKVSYKGGALQIAPSLFVQAQAGGSSIVINSVNNGVIGISISPTPTVAPTAADFVVKQKIDAGTETTSTLSSITASANDPAVVLNVAAIAQTYNIQSLVYAVSYKGGAFVSSSAFNVPAQIPPAPTGFAHDAANKKLVWNPITPPVGGTVGYKISLNGSSGPFNAVSANEYFLSSGTPAGTAELYAILSDANGSKESLHASTPYSATAAPALK
ncbi:MAG TPA: hypothetical protein PKK26_12230, partial [Candidatus Wallbacteria bacterium]|nr:hypothetical protein [Candidatus Wallbacteria bacterium]